MSLHDAHIRCYFGDVPAVAVATIAVPAGASVQHLRDMVGDALASGRFDDAAVIMIALRAALDAAAARNAAALAILANGALQPAPYPVASSPRSTADVVRAMRVRLATHASILN